ncbi:glucose dehydrogenase [FAD, quinone]-like, partial [Hylaeus volcanicus]|uniref:glucose dehydrogenase [FAD, quinone]-like n=1 Tax=Hylaeus volcanicus TaxID=313075 RepID=UPI0023B7EAF0
MDILTPFFAVRFFINLVSTLISVGIVFFFVPIFRPDIVDLENRVRPVITQEIQSSYDVIIIGGGSAGSVLANRITEDANVSVLLLEAGTDEPVYTDVPLFYLPSQNTLLDWGFRPEPSTTCNFAMRNHQNYWPRGRVLGGSSVINAMLYIRGNKKDYDEWENLGNPGWKYESVLPYFKKSEDMRVDGLKGSSYHQTGGPLTVEQFRYRSPVTEYLLKGVTEMGYEEKDVNGASQTGVTYSHGTVRDGLRCSTAKAFIRPASKRKNLHVSLLSYVEKILVQDDGKTKTAYGVQFRQGKIQKEVKAPREVILSAGAIQSPQLLMLSGIGPKDHLGAMGIPVVHDLPGVGQNLRDQAAMGGMTYLVDPPEDYKGTKPFTFSLSRDLTPQTGMEFIEKQSGPYYTALAESMAFVNTKYANASEDFPDIQLFIIPVHDALHGCFGALLSFEKHFNKEWCMDMQTRPSYWVIPLLLRPRTKGHIKLRTKKPEDHPIIVYNYFEDPYDLDVLVEGAKIIHELSKTPTMKKLNATAHLNPVKECSSYETLSDDHLKCLARHYTETIYHPIGTCKMGP